MLFRRCQTGHIHCRCEYHERRQETVLGKTVRDIIHEVIGKILNIPAFQPYTMCFSCLGSEPEHHRIARSIWYGIGKIEAFSRRSCHEVYESSRIEEAWRVTKAEVRTHC